jgi:hypothetical protein
MEERCQALSLLGALSLVLRQAQQQRAPFLNRRI